MKYWKTEGNKKERILYLFKNIYLHHRKTFYKIIRENLPRGIDRRFKQGNPVLLKEITKLDQILRRLSINLSKEIKELNLPAERPRIVPPPIEFQKMIDKIGLHPLIAKECILLYKNGHLNESVRKSLEKLEKYVQDVSKLNDLIGKDLMMQAFNETNPKIKTNNLASKREISQQEGFKFVNAGLMSYIRNKFSHGDEEQISHIDTFELILTVDHILRVIETNLE